MSTLVPATRRRPYFSRQCWVLGATLSAGLISTVPASARASTEPSPAQSNTTEPTAPAQPEAPAEPKTASKTQKARLGSKSATPERPPDKPAEPTRGRLGARIRNILPSEVPHGHKFMIGGLAAVMQTPAPRFNALHVDPRFLGRSVALGGGGVFFRFRPVPIVGFDLSITSGSLRYKDSASGLRIRQDHALWSVGMLLYLTQSKVAQFALSGGTGALAHVVRYDGRARDGKQVFGSGLVFVGAEGEFLLKRVGFILSIRMYGIGTPRSTRTSGQLFEGASSGEKRAPLPRFQTALLASAGVSIRF